ncbi:tRNA(fMet)-specific endonuclease VapC [Halomicronema hongdechloris C2206]|uniref:tRNA(fMet)-specific endonuclease VapC n=1 Tax=Halomicronema hongdechloris C2206 TaxID=1641165 RepID=A0A1Z3HGS1_9CYAN|nr:PIN domain-containing protein [Halomicronema hongdechloris]ASC69481.1 tRNA(fMet)-specific endonuclease VapC [Halomicronema hongdechloris C2206]
MATSEDNGVFIDTNILIYANVSSAPWHQIAIDKLQDLATQDIPLWISRQVLREFIATLTRPQSFATPPSQSHVLKRVQFLQNTFLVADDNAQVTAKLLELIDQVEVGGKQIHDANIVATLLANNVTSLLTHNISDFERFRPWITLIPLIANDSA